MKPPNNVLGKRKTIFAEEVNNPLGIVASPKTKYKPAHLAESCPASFRIESIAESLSFRIKEGNDKGWEGKESFWRGDHWKEGVREGDDVKPAVEHDDSRARRRCGLAERDFGDGAAAAEHGDAALIVVVASGGGFSAPSGCWWSEGEGVGEALLAAVDGGVGSSSASRWRFKMRRNISKKDESALIWLSSSGEKYLKLASVSRIVPGQRTPVFQRHLRPDKDYLSFSLIYKDGKRSLDLICKDKVEAEVWFSGLKALISIGQYGRSKIDGWNNGGFCSEDGRESASNSISDQSVSSTYNSSEGRPTSSNIQNNLSCDYSVPSETSDVTNMHAKGVPSDGFRISVSSVPSTSSHGSAQDDFDAAGDVYVWGEVICDSSTRISADKSSNPSGARTDILLPKPIESNVVLDAHHVACGVRHVALVTRQGELFTWGEESGGRLGHGVGTDIIHPRLLESLSTFNVDYVACGEFHTCAITAAGELYTWGDGTHNAGLLGHGTNVCHWVPKRVSFPLEGLHVSHVSCGVWHTAIITTTGQLFTFGDGTFGVLGHGDRQTLLFPREVESLVGLKTIDVSCGVWHTAAIVEVMVTQSSTSSGKLFTWGDGDKYRLGHGDKVARLKPTCVPSLIDYNFHRLGCGHSLTIGLTTSGQLFTMGSTVYGQLGNPRSDGKYPCLVEDKLAVEPVAEVACGSYHVAVLTSKGEVYTWGKGANGRLGHGDFEDRKLPTLVEALKDRLVKHVSCGSNFTTVICQHKWVSGAEQSLCSACRQPFGFTRKKHNCYNCGLVHCHQCSSKKALRAALSPNPGKPYRVCDSCYVKLTSGLEMGGVNNKKTTKVWLPTDGKDKYDKAETLSKGSLSNNLDLIKNMDTKTAKIGMTFNAFSIVQTPKISSVSPLKTISFPVGIDILQTVSKPVQTSVAKSANLSRAVSPFSRKPTPPRSTTPTPTTSGLSFSKTVSDSLKKTNDLLNHELLKSRAEVESLRQRGERQDFELQKAEKKLKDAMALVAEESAKSKAAKEVIKSLTAQGRMQKEQFLSFMYQLCEFGFFCIQSPYVGTVQLFSRVGILITNTSTFSISTPELPLAHSHHEDFLLHNLIVGLSHLASGLPRVHSSRTLTCLDFLPCQASNPPSSTTTAYYLVPHDLSGLHLMFIVVKSEQSVARYKLCTSETSGAHEVSEVRAKFPYPSDHYVDCNDWSTSHCRMRLPDALPRSTIGVLMLYGDCCLDLGTLVKLKEMAERLPHGIHDSMTMKSLDLSKSDESSYIQHATSAEELNTNDVSNGPSVVASKNVFPGQVNVTAIGNSTSRVFYPPNDLSSPPTPKFLNSKSMMDKKMNPQRSGQGELRAPIVRSENTENRQNPAPRSNDTASAFRETATPRGNYAAPAFRETVTPRGNDAPAAFRSSSTASVDVEAEWIEQFEPGVYITLVTLRDGARDLKRVRFRYQHGMPILSMLIEKARLILLCF
ncbi:hypothetical protein ZIOFF_012135 [Zingiber officinale]|uniref:Uncharacterized protein n=1 Tax=Zingiber officinale TaxID=94328 RepID=A0A8J5HLA4_ZINOF|nr:hypothetical protein ZIOFF_012135 [Zingiber officinale]